MIMQGKLDSQKIIGGTKMKVRIQETLAKIIDISAETEEEALEKVRQLYKTSEIELTTDDFCCVEFDVLQP